MNKYDSIQIKPDAWKKFIDEFDVDSDDKQFKRDFKYMSKKHGQAFIVFCRAMWHANEDVFTQSEFCEFNGGIPKGFFDKIIFP